MTTATADLLAEARALIAVAPWTSGAEVARTARTLLPQLADALEAADAESASYRAWAGKLLASLTTAEARLAKVRERAIKPDIDGGSFYCCLLCNGGYWQQDKPERHNAPDCPARPMEDARDSN